eukprot:5819447-Prymnesium_polylepis.1
MQSPGERSAACVGDGAAGGCEGRGINGGGINGEAGTGCTLKVGKLVNLLRYQCDCRTMLALRSVGVPSIGPVYTQSCA